MQLSKGKKINLEIIWSYHIYCSLCLCMKSWQKKKRIWEAISFSTITESIQILLDSDSESVTVQDNLMLWADLQNSGFQVVMTPKNYHMVFRIFFLLYYYYCMLHQKSDSQNHFVIPFLYAIHTSNLSLLCPLISLHFLLFVHSSPLPSLSPH